MTPLARQLHDARANRQQMAPPSDSGPLDMPTAYSAADEVHRTRVASGERPVGRKIGFTNRTIWPIYNVDRPVWGWMYDSTVHDLTRLGHFPVDLPEARIEPEIVLGLARAPAVGMDAGDLFDCLDWVAPGFEIVTSLYPGWRFTAPDSAAAFGMHGALLIGERIDAGDLTAEALERFTCTLSGPQETLDGHARDVLGGPLHALSHLLDTLDPQSADPVAAGEIVTTGTLTDARPIAIGQTWSATFGDLPVAPLRVTFA